MKISATTVMMPQYDMRETAECLSRLGFDGAEWRCRPQAAEKADYSPWGYVKNDFSPDNIGERGDELLALSKEFNLEIVGLATSMAATQLEEVQKVAEGCAKWGIGKFRIGAPRGWKAEEDYSELLSDTIKAFDEALKITRANGLRVLLEIHRNTVACSASQAYLVVKEFDPADIGVIFDIANMSLGQGHEPTKMGLDLLKNYVAHVHAGGGQPVPTDRNEQGHLQYRWDTVDLADSIIDVPGFVNQLKAMDYQGFLSVEDFREIELEPKIETQLKYLRSLDA
jgi:sugar phosphate isomerase/epimerase